MSPWSHGLGPHPGGVGLDAKGDQALSAVNSDFLGQLSRTPLTIWELPPSLIWLGLCPPPACLAQSLTLPLSASVSSFRSFIKRCQNG